MSTSASEAMDGFARHLADRQFASSTRRIRRHFLDEYLQHAQTGHRPHADHGRRADGPGAHRRVAV